MIHTELLSKENEDICLLLQLDNHTGCYLCDCGTASNLTPKIAQNLNAIFISHTHIDHFINFDELLRHQLGMQKRIVICGPTGIAQQVQAKARGYTWNLIAEGEPNLIYEVREIISDTEIEVYELRPPTWELTHLRSEKDGKLYENKAFQVDFVRLDHGIPTIAYHFQEHDKVNINIANTDLKPGAWIAQLKRAFVQNEGETMLQIGDEQQPAKDFFHLLQTTKGHRVGFVMDHLGSAENHARIASLFAEADKVFIESYYLHSELELAEKNRHSTAQISAKVMRDIGVKKAIPVHFSRRYSEEEIADLRAEFFAIFEVK